MAAAGFIVSLHKRERCTIVVGAAGMLLLVASHLEKAPIYNRLWLFFYPLATLYLIIFLVFLAERKIFRLKWMNCIIPFALALFFLFMNRSFVSYAGDYIEGTEYRPLLAYVEQHADSGDYLFPSFGASSYIGYRYNSSVTGSTGRQLALRVMPAEEPGPELAANMIAAGSSWLMFSKPGRLDEDRAVREADIASCLDLLHEQGVLRLIMDSHDTYLYRFDVNKNTAKEP
jgi:hypothetical protein